MSGGSDRPKKERGTREEAAPQAAGAPKRAAVFDDETMMNLTPIVSLDEPAPLPTAPPPRSPPVDRRTMVHVAASARPATSPYDDQTMRELAPIVSAPPASTVPPMTPPNADETMRLVALPTTPSPSLPPLRPRVDPTIAMAPVPFPPWQAQPAVAAPAVAPPALPPQPAARTAHAWFDPTVTAGVAQVASPPLRSVLPMEPTRTSFVDASVFPPLEPSAPSQAPAPPAPPTPPAATVEAIAAALARKYPLPEPGPLGEVPARGPRASEAVTTPDTPAPASSRTDEAHARRGRSPELPHAGRLLGDTLPILHRTKFAPFVVSWRLRPPTDAIVVIVKATARYIRGEAARLIDAELPSGDVFSSTTEPASLRYPSDFAVFKPRADVMLLGDAYPQRAGNATARIDLTLGDHLWSLAAIGDRHWDGSMPTPAMPFERIPLTWEHALGGALSADNPVGRGYKTGTLLPNLERIGQLITGKRDTPAPVCFAPLSPRWRERAAKAGRYDGKWLRGRWPYLPEDFDFAYFNAAPPELQVAYLRGDEELSIMGVRPGGELVVGALPGARPRVYAKRSAAAGGELFALRMNLDTLLIDTHKELLTLVWRCVLEVADRDALDLEALYVEEAAIGEADDVQGALARFAALSSRVPSHLAEASANETAVAPVGADELEVAKRARRPLRASRGRYRSKRATKSPKPVVVARGTVLEWIADGRSLAGLDLSGVDLRGVDLRGRDLTGALLIDTLLDGAQLDGANCASVVASRLSAADTTWTGANLMNADFSEARAPRADFSQARVTRLIADRFDARGASFRAAHGESVGFREAILEDAAFDDSLLPKADFSAATLHRACFAKARLGDAKFYDVDGELVSLDDADLQDARFERAHLPSLSARRVDARRSVWERADVKGGTFEEAKLADASFERVEATGTLFNKVVAPQACFRGASLTAACFLKAELTKATFEQADLTNADFRGAILDGVETWEATLTGVDLRHASVIGSKLATGKRS